MPQSLLSVPEGQLRRNVVAVASAPRTSATRDCGSVSKSRTLVTDCVAVVILLMCGMNLKSISSVVTNELNVNIDNERV